MHREGEGAQALRVRRQGQSGCDAQAGAGGGGPKLPGNPFDGHILAAQLEQTTNLLQDLGRRPTQAIVDLGFRGVDADNPGVEIIHRGKYKTLTSLQRRWLKRRQAIEPMIGHAKSDNRMDRCWLQGTLGDALHALSCAAGYNIRWLMRAIARLAAKRSFYALFELFAYARISVVRLQRALVGETGSVPGAIGRLAAMLMRLSGQPVQLALAGN